MPLVAKLELGQGRVVIGVLKLCSYKLKEDRSDDDRPDDHLCLEVWVNGRAGGRGASGGANRV